MLTTERHASQALGVEKPGYRKARGRGGVKAAIDGNSEVGVSREMRRPCVGKHYPIVYMKRPQGNLLHCILI